jgi:CRP-like cAMP-binding protein
MRQKEEPMGEYRQLFEQCPLWRGVSTNTLDRALASARSASFLPEEVIYQKDRFYQGLGMVAKGRALTSKTSVEGRRMPMSVLEPGGLFGAVTVFGNAARFETDIYAGPQGCTALFLCRETVLELLQSDFILVENYLSYLCSRIRFLSGRVDALFGTDAKSKFLSYLYHNADETGAVRLEDNMAQLAAKLSVSRATVYRAMDALMAEGTIRREGKRIYLL